MTQIKFLTDPSYIGGNAILISHQGSKIVLDCGMEDRSPYPPIFFASKPLDYLERFGKIPMIPSDVSGVLISHAHADHYCGLFAQEHELTVYSSKFARENIGLAYYWEWDSTYPKLDHRFPELKGNLEFDDISITPIPVSHSTIEAYAFLVETPDARILYTGDFRPEGHMKTDLSLAKGVDLLILDATNVGVTTPCLKENDVISKVRSSIKEKDGMIIIFISNSNVRRVAEIIKSAKVLGRRVTVSPNIMSKYRVFLHLYGIKRELEPEGEAPIDSEKEDVVILDRLDGWCSTYLFLHLHEFFDDSSKVIISLNTNVNGYERITYESLKRTLRHLGVSVEEAHASGHSYPQELRKVINEISPKVTIPIHTRNIPKRELQALDKTVRIPDLFVDYCLGDGES
jgi:ribonuclease J